MSITDQHPIRTSPNAAALHRDMDDVAEQLHALEVTAVRLAEERDREKTRADQAEAAGVDMAAAIADSIRREIRLSGENKALKRIITGLEGLLVDYTGANWRLGEHVARLAQVERDLREELANQPSLRRLLRRRVQEH